MIITKLGRIGKTRMLKQRQRQRLTKIERMIKTEIDIESQELGEESLKWLKRQR